MGAGADVLAAAEAEMKSDPVADAYAAAFFDVWPENWDSVMFFLSCSSQWIVSSAGMGAVRTGLDYTRVESAARMQGLPRKRWPGLFADLQCMEVAVLEADEQRREAAR